MKLHSLRIEPSGPTGWSSPELLFGSHITELFGPNGCGKTPMIQSIAYALGYPVKFRDDILKQCGAAVLKVQHADGLFEFRRKISSQFDVEVRSGSIETQFFYSEREYSKFLLDLFGFATPTLTSIGSEPVAPYVATLLPLFFLDQDHGYTSAYKAQNFIKDQYSEMMRLTFGLPAKHPYDQKKLLIEKQRRLESIDRAIVKKTRASRRVDKRAWGNPPTAQRSRH